MFSHFKPLQTELKREAYKFVDMTISSRSFNRVRLKNCIEELISQRDFWAQVPPGITKKDKFNILRNQHDRIIKILTQHTICPNCGAIDFNHQKSSGMAVTVNTLKTCIKCNTSFN